MASSTDDFASRVEEYLASIKENKTELNPKLKKEQKQLEELLESYKKLCDKFDKRCNINGVDVKKISVRQPEIRAILQPALYTDIREEKKEALRKGFSNKRIFSEEQKRLGYVRSPKVYTKNIGDAEKDRLCHILAASPSKFHNSNFTSGKRIVRHFNPNRTNLRENEKDRLARIFATSSPIMKSSDIQNRINKKIKFQPEEKKVPQKIKIQPEEKIQRYTKKPIVKIESPKNGIEITQRPYQPVQSNKIDKAVETDNMSSSMSSVSTQTDLDDINFCESIGMGSGSPCSPREKLIADLYGAHGNSGNIADKKRTQQIAYAEALRQQIKEKKRLDTEKSMKEVERYRLIDKRTGEQSKQLQLEYLRDKNEQMEDAKLIREYEKELFQQKLLEEQSKLEYLMDQNNHWNDNETSIQSGSRSRYDSENNSMLLNESVKSRPTSPLVPAIKAKNILKNKQLVNGKSETLDIDKDFKYENILGQLGAFRRQLALEHQLLERKLETGS